MLCWTKKEWEIRHSPSNWNFYLTPSLFEHGVAYLRSHYTDLTCWELEVTNMHSVCFVSTLPLSERLRVMLCPLLFFLRDMSLAWEISLTMEDRCSLLLPLWRGGEALESPSALSLLLIMDLLWRKPEMLFHLKIVDNKANIEQGSTIYCSLVLFPSVYEFFNWI